MNWNQYTYAGHHRQSNFLIIFSEEAMQVGRWFTARTVALAAALISAPGAPVLAQMHVQGSGGNSSTTAGNEDALDRVTPAPGTTSDPTSAPTVTVYTRWVGYAYRESLHSGCHCTAAAGALNVRLGTEAFSVDVESGRIRIAHPGP